MIRVIDNFDKFKFEFKEGEFYFFQILDRSKSGGNNKTRCIKSYFIDNQEFFDKKKPEMIAITNAFPETRLYVHPARRNKLKIALQNLAYIAKSIDFGELDRLGRSYETVCGRSMGVKKMWIVDVDSRDPNDLNTTINKIKELKPFRDPLYVLDTVNGYHLVYEGGFDRRTYDLPWDIHTNNPTMIYAKVE